MEKGRREGTRTVAHKISPFLLPWAAASGNRSNIKSRRKKRISIVVLRTSYL